MIVDSSEYDESYFLGPCGGSREWKESFGLRLDKRLSQSLGLAQISQGDFVLDFGCGRGEMVLHSALRNAHVCGGDYSLYALSLARETLRRLVPPELSDRAAVAMMSCEFLPFRDSVFDAILCLDVVEHLSRRQLCSLLKEFYRVLKQNGRLIAHTMPNRLYMQVRQRLMVLPVKNFCRRLRKQPPLILRSELDQKLHVNEQTVGSLRKVLRDYGFTSRVWAEDKYDMHTKPLASLINMVLTLGPLSRIFAHDIWAVAAKRGAARYGAISQERSSLTECPRAGGAE